MNPNGVEFDGQPRDCVAARNAWLEVHLDELDELDPIHACGILLRDTLEATSDYEMIEFVEYTNDGRLCAGRNSRNGAWALTQER